MYSERLAQSTISHSNGPTTFILIGVLVGVCVLLAIVCAWGVYQRRTKQSAVPMDGLGVVLSESMPGMTRGVSGAPSTRSQAESIDWISHRHRTTVKNWLEKLRVYDFMLRTRAAQSLTKFDSQSVLFKQFGRGSGNRCVRFNSAKVFCESVSVSIIDHALQTCFLFKISSEPRLFSHYVHVCSLSVCAGIHSQRQKQLRSREFVF